MSSVAVIIPVYNAADTLSRLLATLRGQTLRDFVAIFVDDGSSDESREILRAASAADDRFQLLACAHGGPGAARNIGLDRADELKADFIAFLDADDYFAPDALETAVGLLQKTDADIVHFPWAADEAGLAAAGSISQPSIYVWNKVYRRSAVEGVRFLQATFAEDLAYFLETDARRPKRVACPRALYVHVKRAGSLWESRSPGDVVAAMRTVIDHLSSFLGANPSLPGAADWTRLYLLKLLKNWWRAIKRFPRSGRERQKALFVDHVKVLHAAGQIPLLCFGAFRFRLFCHWLVWSAPIAEAGRWMSQGLSRIRYSLRYRRQLRKVRNRVDKPIRVLFLVSEISKWKTRTLFELMAASSDYDPVVGVGLDECEMRSTPAERRRLMESRMDWFRQRNLASEPVFDVASGGPVDLRRLRPDVVFYQQPWQIPKPHRPTRVSHFALTFYVPYCMADFGNLEAECLMPFFRQIFVYFVQSRSWTSLYRVASRGVGCRFVATGHPIIDRFGSPEELSREGEYVIYAPHWTFRYPGRNDLYPYGTFNGNGREILDYAKRHSEWRWVFKPHPLLRAALVERGLMSQPEVEAYYAEWEKLGTACYDADYPSLFVKSRAMITDSGSFLVEYGATGRPLIHLKPYDSRVELLPPNRELFGSYYSATDLDGMFRAFSVVLEQRKDPLGDRRRAAVRAAGLFNRRASERILRYLNNMFMKGERGLCRD